MILDTIIELSSAKNIYKDCWLNGLPKDYNSPTEIEIKWLWQLVVSQNFYQNLNTTKQQNLQEIINNVEAAIPMITEDGTVLNVHHRLYLSYCIAKLFIHKQVVPLDVISSIVIYPTLKLRKVHNESGLVVCKGANMLLKPIHSIYKIIDLLTKIYTDTAASVFLMLTKINGDFIKKTHQNWVEDLKYIETIINKKQTYFQDKIEQKLNELNEKLITFDAEILPALLQENANLQSTVVEASLCYKELINQLATLKRFLPMLHEVDKVSIHLSWQAILKNMQNDSDLIVHEMAHVIDFTNGGLDGVPSTSRKSKEIWNAAFKQEEQRQSILNTYAFTNELEFFAVCNETFFKNPEALKQKIPSIYNALTMLYGYESQKNNKASTFNFFKMAFISKISVLKL